MKFALSTNWNNRRLKDGAAIADEALALGFDALELGFRTTSQQLQGFKARLADMPVNSIHAYVPVPVGAPGGHPELHQLASLDATERALAIALMKKTIACASELNAKVIVTHAGYVSLDGLFLNYGTPVLSMMLTVPDGKPDTQKKGYQRWLKRALKRRQKNGPEVLDAFKAAFDVLVPFLQRNNVVLALENLPSLEAFPNLEEAETLMKNYEGAPLRLWFDTGHARVRACHLWTPSEVEIAQRLNPYIAGMHLNDVKDFHDDHRQPGWGNVDFNALKPLATGDILRVFEPHEPVTFDDLQASLLKMRQMWQTP